ncbi:MAG: alcohol dehydrogenase catalytic domain-containing protein [Saprospiraceae bacterium]|nr:alcohol dehydrogenase catalytic domain-containing protein [Saprospiraceae bacterium]
MHALTFQGKETITYERVADPSVLAATDAIVKVEMAGICGSDLHVYHCRETGLDNGTVMGHEFVGEVVEIGRDVKRFRRGTKVFSPFTTSCGVCFYCQIGLTCRCEKGSFYGWVEKGSGLHGGQAEYVRVPLADTTLLPLSMDLTTEQGLLLGDIFSTGYFCADMAHIQPKGVYVVIGCGPVGLMAVVGAKNLGATQLYAIDTIPERLKKAQEFGAIPLNLLSEGSSLNSVDVVDKIKSVTNGRGADAVLEVVGSPSASRLAVDLVRAGGIISTVGVHTTEHFSFSPVEAYNKNLTYKVGRCPARFYAEKLIKEEIVQRYDIASIITHRFDLKNGAEAYRIFDRKEDNCLKSVLLT